MKPKEQEAEKLNEAEPPEALHSEPAWEPAASAKTPALEKEWRQKKKEGNELEKRGRNVGKSHSDAC